MTEIVTQIYRSKKKEGAYLYTKLGKDLNELPQALLQQLGKLEQSMVLKLTKERKLAQADANRVIQSLEENGYYLQLPPPPESYMQGIENSKMPTKPIG